MKQCKPYTERGFTLIELLIVISIIGILAAILLPALAGVKYKAKLLTCMNNQKQAVVGGTLYATENNSRFPVNYGVEVNDTYVAFPFNLRKNGSANPPLWDNRYHLNEYIPLEDINCPFSPAGNFFPSVLSGYTLASYNFYFGFKVKDSMMKRLSDTMRFYQATTGREAEFDVLVSDINYLYTDSPRAFSGHPERRNSLMSRGMFTSNPTNFLSNIWALNGSYYRGPIDLNVCRKDGSAITVRNVTYDDRRDGMGRIYYKYNNDDDINAVKRWSALPTTDY